MVAGRDVVAEDEVTAPVWVQSATSQGHLYAVEVHLGGVAGPSVRVLAPVWWWQRHGERAVADCRLAIARGSIHMLTG